MRTICNLQLKGSLMSQYPHHTWREIQSQPEAWAAALEVLRVHADEVRALGQNGGYDSVIFTGCGSPYYLALAAAATFQELTGCAARGVPASEIWLNPRAALHQGGRVLLVALSRSGETTETLRAVESFRSAGRGDVLTLSCYPGRPLTSLGDLNLIFPSGQEQSMAQTRAFSVLYLATVALAALWTPSTGSGQGGGDDLLAELDRLPGVCRRLLNDTASLTQNLGGDATIDRFYFLGSGPRYGLACELSLKMKEMSISHSEPFHFMEFRHGPRAMAGPGALLVGLISAANQAHEQAVLEDMRGQGARVLALGERAADVAFGTGLSAAASDLLFLPVGQLLGFQRALHNGCNPDQPENLAAVVVLPEA
jgi:glutamine---fructose-6-phosphate transaminase (isomerizing)